MLRAWPTGPDAQVAVWNDLCVAIGHPRARACLQAFEQMLSLLKAHGWHAPLILAPDARGYSEDELSLARFVLAAAEQRREVALAEASFLVSPQVLLPFLCAASRVGLPLMSAKRAHTSRAQSQECAPLAVTLH
ncbi:hypothetical protein [Marivita sp. GX14005]|uniref:hypothetical protein n=1 Tax=Marivita sp. GX14005 TaxID=2942276 RepID=UPI002019C214|nr:hypothetical protein [Marivita sp. GX14005]MCL3881533.1 hypothetical protein [Marivita sp. GX14005]